MRKNLFSCLNSTRKKFRRKAITTIVISAIVFLPCYASLSNKLAIYQSFPIAGQIAWSPDGKRLAIDVQGVPHVVTIWDASTGKKIQTLQPIPIGEHSLVFLKDSNQILIPTFSRQNPSSLLSIWDVRQGHIIKEIGQSGQILRSQIPYTLSASSNGSVLATENSRANQINVFSLNDFSLLHRIDMNAVSSPTANAIVVSPDGNYLAFGPAAHSLQIYNIKTGQMLWSRKIGHLGMFGSLSFSSDSKLLATNFDISSGISHQAHSSSFLNIIDLNGNLVSSNLSISDVDNVSEIRWLPGNLRLAVVSNEGLEIIPLSKSSTDHLKLRYVDHVEVSPDGKSLAIVRLNQTELMTLSP